jgi:hypothetical protein
MQLPTRLTSTSKSADVHIDRAKPSSCRPLGQALAKDAPIRLEHIVVEAVNCSKYLLNV